MRIGLTGGIGSGKSTVASAFARRGATVIDTDAIARRLTAAGGDAMPALRQAFGPTVLSADGALDRAKMRALAFSDPTAKQRLEAVLHPLIGVQALHEAAAALGCAVVFDVPLLAESQQWRQRVDRILVVDCGEATQIERVSQRGGWTRDWAARVIGSQASRSMRRGVADAVLFNEGISLEMLESAVGTLWNHWLPMAEIAVEQ